MVLIVPGNETISEVATMRSLALRTAVATVLLGFVCADANAATLATWDVSGVDLNAAGASGIDGNSTSSPYTYTGVLASDVSDAKLTLSSSVSSSTSSNQYGFKISGGSEETTLAGAITAGHYLQFTITAASGFVLNLTDVTMNAQSSSTGADNVALLSNLGDGFVSTAAIDSVSGNRGVTGGFDTDASGFGAGTIDLSASTFQGISSATFRLYGFDTTSGSGVTYLRNLSGNDLVINGAVTAVPEPSTLILAIGGLLGVALWGLRRRR